MNIATIPYLWHFIKMSESNIPVIYEDNDILVINKPAGLSVHGDGRSTDYTLVDWITTHRPVCIGVGEPMNLADGGFVDRPGIVHRLDKDTSGVLVIAKTDAAYHFLKQAFHDRSVKKTYHALVYGVPKNKEGVIESAIGRSRKDPRVRLAHAGAVGKLRDAKTRYEVAKSFTDYSFLNVYPETGRTHQIRVHLKYIQHPIVCDSLYAPGKPCLPGLSRQALHAAELVLPTPTGPALALRAPYPADFQAALDYLESL